MTIRSLTLQFSATILSVGLSLLLGCCSTQEDPAVVATVPAVAGGADEASESQESPGEAGEVQAAAHTITVEVTGFQSDAGALLVYLFDSSDTFPGEYDAAVASLECTISEGAASAVLSDVAPGTYAVSAIHDEDGNGELRTNFMGIPKEAVGTSNNPAPRMGPPRWKDARFTLEGDLSLSIELQYP